MVARRGTGQIVEELETLLQFNDLLVQLSKHSEAGRFPPGVGPVSLLGIVEYSCMLASFFQN